MGFILPCIWGINEPSILEWVAMCQRKCCVLCLTADVCKRGDVTVEPSRVLPLGSAVNISCSLKPKQGCSPYSNFNRLSLYKFHQKIKFQHGHSLSSQVSDLPRGTTVFVCKLACGSSEEIQICGAEISVGGEHSILNC